MEQLWNGGYVCRASLSCANELTSRGYYFNSENPFGRRKKGNELTANRKKQMVQRQQTCGTRAPLISRAMFSRNFCECGGSDGLVGAIFSQRNITPTEYLL